MKPKNKKNHGKAPAVAKKPAPAAKKRGRPAAPPVGLPIFDSMAQCGASTGIPPTALKRAKDGGCPAFRSNRVYLAELLPWMFAHGVWVLGKADSDADIADLDLSDPAHALKCEQAIMARIRRTKLQNRTADKGEVCFGLNGIMAYIFACLDRWFKSELPPDLKGMTELQISRKCDTVIEAFKADLRTRFQELEKGKEE